MSIMVVEGTDGLAQLETHEKIPLEQLVRVGGNLYVASEPCSAGGVHNQSVQVLAPQIEVNPKDNLYTSLFKLLDIMNGDVDVAKQGSFLHLPSEITARTNLSSTQTDPDMEMNDITGSENGYLFFFSSESGSNVSPDNCVIGRLTYDGDSEELYCHGLEGFTEVGQVFPEATTLTLHYVSTRNVVIPNSVPSDETVVRNWRDQADQEYENQVLASLGRWAYSSKLKEADLFTLEVFSAIGNIGYIDADEVVKKLSASREYCPCGFSDGTIVKDIKKAVQTEIQRLTKMDILREDTELEGFLYVAPL